MLIRIPNAKIVNMTGKAAAIWINGGPHKGGKGDWIPLSLIHEDSPIWEGGDILIIPEWIAIKKGFIDAPNNQRRLARDKSEISSSSD